MQVKLVVVSGKNAGQAIPVSGERFFIGRAEDCNLRPYSDLISRHHCAILMDQGVVLVRDFGSKNGTFINGERVRTEQEAKNGDRLKVGDLEFELQLTVELVGKKLSKVHSVQEAAARSAEVASRTVNSATDDEELARLMSDETGTLAADSETKTLHMSRIPKKAATPAPATRAVTPKPATPPKTPATPAKTAQPPAKPVQTAAAEPPQEEPKIPTKTPGARVKKIEGPSSQDAAAAMLSKFFKGY